MNNVKISVVTVCYNAVKELERTMLSVLNQTYDNVEYIVIDGGSTDGTVEIIKKYADRLAYWVSEPDKGIYDAMNKGIKVATGEWINFMNAGDSFVDERVINNITKSIKSNTDVFFGDIIVERHNEIYRIISNCNHLDNPKLCSMGFNHQSAFVKTQVAKKEPFSLKYKFASDFNMMYILHSNGYSFQYIPIAVANYDTSGVSSTNARKHRLECLNIVDPGNSLNIIKSYFFITKKKIKDYIVFICMHISPFIVHSYFRKKSDYQLLKTL